MTVEVSEQAKIATGQDEPTVTVGLIAYNALDTLERALDSALAQTHRPLEILIVDDGSTDGTAELAARLAERHPSVRTLPQARNSGAAVSRNVVMDEARGEFIAFFDDDDVSDARRVQMQLARLLEYERRAADGAPVVCHTARLQHYPDGSSRIAPTMGERGDRSAPHGIAVARRILLGDPLRDAYGSCATCSQLIRTATLRALGGFDPLFRRSQDTELCIRLAKAGAHFVGVGAPLVTQTMTRSSDKGIERERIFWLVLLDTHRDLCRDRRQYRNCRRWINIRHDWLSRQRARFWWRLLMSATRAPLFTLRRIWLSLPNLGGNRAFSRFHRGR